MKNKKSFARLSALTSAVLFALPSTYISAETTKLVDEKTEKPSYRKIETITVLGKAATEYAELGGLSLKELPINTHVVGRAEIERLRFVDPNELLDRIPGETQVRNLRIPDGAKSYTIPSLDGLPLENPYEGATQRLDRVNTSDIERVEVIKGPASALYFNNAFGGVVNVISRTPPKTPETQISVEAGKFDRFRAGVTTAGTVNDIGYFFDINTRDLKGLRDEAVDNRDQVSGKLTYQLTDNTYVSARAEYLDEFVVERGDLTAEELADDPTQAGSLSSSEDLTQSAFSVNFAHTLTSGQIKLDVVRREKDTIGESRFSGPQDENDVGYGSKLTYRHDLERSDIIVGYNGYHSEQDTKEFSRGDSDLTGDFDAFVNHFNINAYFAQYHIEATDKLSLTFGLRYENIHLDSTSSPQSISFSDTAPKFGLTYQAHENHLIWLGVSDGFYAPDLDDLFDAEEGNPDLQPEEATNIEIGFRGKFGNFHYDSSFYYNDISNYLVTQEFFRTVTGDDGLIQEEEFEQTTNAGRVSAKGIESVFEYVPKNANWRAALTHTYTRNTYDRFVQSTIGADDDLSGNVLRRSPDHHVNARVAWTPTSKLTVEFEGDFYSSYFADNENSPESKFTRDERFNIRVNYELNRWDFWFHALNLTDTQEDRATFSRGEFTFRTIDGRNFYTGASYRF